MQSSEIIEHLENHSNNRIDDIYIFEPNEENQSFEEIYLSLREKEGRIYDNSEIRKLPHLTDDHELSDEWKLREKNAKRFRKYLQNRKEIWKNKRDQSQESLLLMGCGNGWFSNYLADIQDLLIIGIDINMKELKQATKTKISSNQIYIYGDISSETDIIPKSTIDLVVFNSSFQYFENFTFVYKNLQPYLTKSAEIHIIDTMIYNEEEVKDAKDRSAKYFKEQSFPEMISNYYHHSFSEFDNFEYEIMYNPNSLINKIKSLITKQSPFYWIKILTKVKIIP